MDIRLQNIHLWSQFHPRVKWNASTLFLVAAPQISEENSPPLRASLEVRWYPSTPTLSLQSPILGPFPSLVLLLETRFGHLKVPVLSRCNTMASLLG